MHTRLVKLRRGSRLLVRPLTSGDVETVGAVFARLGEQSRRARFLGPKPCVPAAELEQMATVDSRHHALVGYVDGDPKPAAIASLVRTGAGSAEIAFAVADEYQHRGIGSALTRELLNDARAAGIAEITALTRSDNRATLALLRRCADVLDVHFEGAELSIRAAIA
jgi:ribosomal protein S18 acetylase RimI-like enzyme